MTVEHQYIAIDLKSFYASVECVERGIDPLDALLVVADESRTDKTICLAVSPALKKYGTGGRPRLFEVKQKVKEANALRRRYSPFTATSKSMKELSSMPDLGIDFHVAPPRMGLYLDYSRRIYKVYLKYIAPEDIYAYSVDEVFIDATSYLKTYKMTAHELTMHLIREVLRTTGITATAGIGTNMYLAKIAMDIVAKKMAPDKDGVRIAELDSPSYRRQLWTHTPLTDFWRIGKGTASKLAKFGICTMGDIALVSLRNEAWLFRLFGVNAELLIDHAWGREPVTMKDVKSYRPATKSLSSGQVLTEPYSSAKARNVVLEMADSLSLDLIDKKLVTSQITLEIGYDVESITRSGINYEGPIHIDRYGRKVPKSAHGSININPSTSAGSVISTHTALLFDRIINNSLLVRRITISANKLTSENDIQNISTATQPSLFPELYDSSHITEKNIELSRERRRQEVELKIKKKFGKNALLKGLNFTDGATQRERNSQIGGHHE